MERTPILISILLFTISHSTAHIKTNIRAPPPTQPPPADYNGCFDKVYAFGDSYTDTGNAELLGGLKSFISAFLSSMSRSNTTPATGRLSNGRLVVDFLCESLHLPKLPPYKNTTANFSSGANFAIAGSTSLASNFFLKNKIPRALLWKTIPEAVQTQSDWFSDLIGQNQTNQLENALFWVGEIGLNDYARAIGTALPIFKSVTENSVAHVSKLLRLLLEKGAKYLVVQGLPPLGCLPLGLTLSPSSSLDTLGCSVAVNSLIMAHNDLLQKMIPEFQKLFIGSTIVYADYWNAFRTILSNSAKYRFQETFKACCGSGGGLNFNSKSFCGAAGTSACANPGLFINWDGLHLTEAMNRQIADLLLNRGFCKPSFSDVAKKKMSAPPA